MTVVLQMIDGSRYHLDRGLTADAVAEAINDAREEGRLIPFERDLTPTGQMIYIDPDEVIVITTEDW